MRPPRRKGNVMKYLIFFILVVPVTCYATSYQPIDTYQAEWCTKNGGQVDYIAEDEISNFACIKDQYAICLDYIGKWKEAVGQALYYSVVTGKKPGIAVITTNSQEDSKKLKSLKLVSDKFKIMVWEIK